MKEYLYNPFNIKNKSELELQKMYQDTFLKLIEEPNSMYEYATNIEVYSNLNYLVGEIIARLTRDIINIKTNIEINKSIKMVEERKLWQETMKEKPPAMAYFEALGTRFCQTDINTLADMECSLKRFKNAYNSITEKINALKKKMESIKFEEFE